LIFLKLNLFTKCKLWILWHSSFTDNPPCHIDENWLCYFNG